MLRSISESQNKVLKIYRDRLTHGLPTTTYQDVADRLNINVSAVHKHVQNLIKRGYLYKDTGGKIFLQKTEALAKIPLLGEIACGQPLHVFEEYEKAVEVPSSMLKGLGEFYALTAKGASMEGMGIFDGDTLIVRQQDDVHDGEIGVIIEQQDFDEYATLKTVYHTKSAVLGKPANPKFEKIVIDRKNAEVRGKLMGIIRNI